MAASLLGPGGKVFGRFLGNTVSAAAGFSAGAAIGPVLGPVVQAIKNTVNASYAFVYPDPVTMALGVAQGQIPEKTARTYASYHGFGDDAMTALIEVANVGPQLGQAYSAWRRGLLTDTQFKTALKRTGLEDQWVPAMLALKTELLDPADLARGIHKGLIPDPGLLATPAPTGTGKVPAYPVYQIDAVEQATGQGYTKDYLGVLVGLQGNPMGAHEAAQATFRGVIEQVDYDRAIAEGNTRNEWGEAIFEQSRAIPSPTNYVEGFIRNWISKQAMYDGAARHGMSTDDTDLIFLNHGRPLTHNQVFIGLLRGGTYDGPTDQIDPAYLKSLQESDMRPEWYNLSWAGRFHYPAFFQVVSAFTKGIIDAPTATEWLTYQGYDPAAIAAVIKPPGATGAKAKPLTAAQIRSAWRSNQITEPEALTRLEALGYTAADAQILLNNPGATAPAA